MKCYMCWDLRKWIRGQNVRLLNIMADWEWRTLGVANRNQFSWLLREFSEAVLSTIQNYIPRILTQF